MASVGDLLASGGKWSTFVLRTAVLVTFVCIAYIGARERNQELLPASPDMSHFYFASREKYAKSTSNLSIGLFSLCSTFCNPMISPVFPGFYGFFFVQESVLNYLWAMMWVRNSDIQKELESWKV